MFFKNVLNDHYDYQMKVFSDVYEDTFSITQQARAFGKNYKLGQMRSDYRSIDETIPMPVTRDGSRLNTFLGMKVVEDRFCTENQFYIMDKKLIVNSVHDIEKIGTTAILEEKMRREQYGDY